MKKKVLIVVACLFLTIGGVLTTQNVFAKALPTGGPCKSDSNMFCNGDGSSCYCLSTVTVH